MKIGTEQIKPSRYRPGSQVIPFYRPSKLEQQFARELQNHGAVLAKKAENGGGYELIQGEKSWRIAIAIGLMEMEVQIVQPGTGVNEQQLFDEDFHLTYPNPISRAKLYRWQLMAGESLSSIAKGLGAHRANIKHYLNLLDLPKIIQDDLLMGKLREGHARHLSGLSPANQLNLWKAIKERRLTVKDAWALCRSQKNDVMQSPPYSPTLTSSQGQQDKDPNIRQFERMLTDHFGHTVRIEQDANEKPHRLVFEYFDNEGLESILDHTDFTFD